MAKNLKKFVNPKFTRTIGLAPMRRLLERHRDALALDLSILDGDPATARAAIQDFFAGPEEAYPEGLVADLHRIAEVGDADGLRLLLDVADRLCIAIAPERDPDGGETCQDPKHFALRVFLDFPLVFETASDMLAMTARTSLAEYAGVEEGVEAELTEETKAAFEAAAAKMFEADHRGCYCRVGWYADADEVNLVITHGSLVRTTPIVDAGAERVISFRAAEHAVLSYSALAGRLKIGGVPMARRAEVAKVFATTMMQRPEFFAAEDAQNLYTLAPIERIGCGFTFNHAFDPGIREVQIVAAQADLMGVNPRTGQPRVLRSVSSRDGFDSALAGLSDGMRGEPFGNDWRLNHIDIRIHFDVGGRRPAKVAVKIKPPTSASFKRHRFEDRIMTLLRRNGLVHDRFADLAAIAAE
ncbi:MAG: hypothetical protein U1E40_06870 [Amaricoccus sp.]|nr:hypothetical protein [Paracoccaceae bacterium]